MENSFHSGFVTIIGRPNVGKSTLLNAMVGEKVAIVSDRPQTTRNKIMGITTCENYQAIFVDTPGIHNPRNKLGEFMMRSVKDAMDGMDALIVMLDASLITGKDRQIAEEYSKTKVPKVLVLNKIDIIEKNKLLEIIGSFSSLSYNAIIPVSARTEDGLDELRTLLYTLLPEGPKYFPEDMMTDQPERVICAEMIREKALLHLRDEVPHGIGVEIMQMKKENDGFMEIHATIYCEREAHKGIIIGKRGAMLQIIGSEARHDIENLLGLHVNLQLWVKVRENWRNSQEDLRNLGYENN